MRKLRIPQSKLTGEITQKDVERDILSRGWQPITSALEQPYDIIVDLGIDFEEEKRFFQTIQVKSWNSLKTNTRPYTECEIVSVNGKRRNNYDYYDECIDWIASVNLATKRVVYWSRNAYQKKSPSQLKKTDPQEFPINEGVSPYRNPTYKEENIFSNSSLLEYMS